MFPAQYASSHPERLAVIMATSGDTITYAELEARSNRLAHLLRAQGLKRLDHYSVLMENHIKYFEACVAGERSGLYCTCINSYLKADEVAYILQNSESQVLITSPAKLEVAKAAMEHCPNLQLCLVVDSEGHEFDDGGPIAAYESAVAIYPTRPIDDEAIGTAML